MARRPVPEPSEQRAWGDPGAAWDPGPPPRNHLPWTILVSALCCLPLGLVGVYFSTQVNPKWAAGDHYGAAEAATRAKRWIWITLGVGFFVDLMVGAALLAARNAA